MRFTFIYLLVTALFSGLAVLAATPDSPQEKTDEASQAPEGGGLSREHRDLDTPGYGIPTDARSPFHPASAYKDRPGTEEAAAESVLTDSAVDQMVNLEAVVSSGGITTAIINRAVFRQGQTLTIERHGQTFTLRLVNLIRTPPTAVLAHEDRQFTVTTGKTRTPTHD